MADLGTLAEHWSQYEGQVIEGLVTCPTTDRVVTYWLKLVNVLWNGISDRVSFRLNDGQGSDREFLLTEQQIQRTPQQVLAGFKQHIKQALLDGLDASEFEDLAGEEL